MFGDFTPFMSKTFQIWDHLFSALFPKDSESLKTLYIRLGEVGAKRCLNGTSKVNDKQTEKPTDILRVNALKRKEKKPWI